MRTHPSSDEIQIFSAEQGGYMTKSNKCNQGDETRDKTYWNVNEKDATNGMITLTNRDSNRLKISKLHFIDVTLSNETKRVQIQNISTSTFLKYKSKIELSSERKKNGTENFFQWDLIDLKNGFYNIRHVATLAYINGDKEIVHITARLAEEDNDFRWKITKDKTNNGDSYTIKNASNDCYLGSKRIKINWTTKVRNLFKSGLDGSYEPRIIPSNENDENCMWNIICGDGNSIKGEEDPIDIVDRLRQKWNEMKAFLRRKWDETVKPSVDITGRAFFGERWDRWPSYKYLIFFMVVIFLFYLVYMIANKSNNPVEDSETLKTHSLKPLQHATPNLMY